MLRVTILCLLLVGCNHLPERDCVICPSNVEAPKPIGCTDASNC